MNFITSKRVREEGLEGAWRRYTDDQGQDRHDWSITDADGVVYAAEISEDGTISHQTGEYSGPEAFEQYTAPSELIARKKGPCREGTLYRCRDTGSFFDEQWIQSYGSPLIRSVTKDGAFRWFFETGERDRVELSDIGFVTVGSQPAVKEEIENLLRAGRCSVPDWVRKHLSVRLGEEPSIADAGTHDELAAIPQGEPK